MGLTRIMSTQSSPPVSPPEAEWVRGGTGKVTQAGKSSCHQGSGNYNPNSHQTVQILNSRSTELATGVYARYFTFNICKLRVQSPIAEGLPRLKWDVYLISRQVSLSPFLGYYYLFDPHPKSVKCEERLSDLLICWLKLLGYTSPASVSTMLMPGAQGGQRGCCMPWDCSCDGCEHHTGLGIEYSFCDNINGCRECRRPGLKAHAI